MDLNITKITKNDINKYRDYLKKYEPYEEDDPVLKTFDSKCDANRLQATTARRILECFGIDPYDDDDYGTIKD